MWIAKKAYNTIKLKMGEILIPAITSFTTVIVAIIATFQAIKIKKLDKENTEDLEKMTDDKNHLSGVSFLTDFNVMNELISIVEDIQKNTKINRFVILYGINGKTEVTTVSSLFEMENQEYLINVKYKLYDEISIDNHMRFLIKELETKKDLILSTDDLPESLLKNIYLKQNIKNALLKFISRKPLDINNDIILYSSFGSFSSDLLTVDDLNYIESRFNRLKKLIDKL